MICLRIYFQTPLVTSNNDDILHEVSVNTLALSSSERTDVRIWLVIKNDSKYSIARAVVQLTTAIFSVLVGGF